jgi:hypothetical protein
VRLFDNGAFSIASKNDLDDQNLLLATVGTMADNKFRPACHWLDIKM